MYSKKVAFSFITVPALGIIILFQLFVQCSRINSMSTNSVERKIKKLKNKEGTIIRKFIFSNFSTRNKTD